MKYIATILLLTLAFASKSQTFINRAGAANTVIDARLGAAQNFYLPRLTDTTLSGGKDSIADLIYDRLRAKIWIRDTVLLGGHKFTQLFKEDDTATVLATKYDLTLLSGNNISNASLVADGNYLQNWSDNQWVVDSISGQFLFRMGGIGNTGTRRKEFRINWGGSSFGDNLDGFNMLASVKKADLSADSLTMGLMSSGTGVLSMGIYDVATSNNNTFISYSTLGLINIRARDSIRISGAVPAATADSILGVVFRSPGVSKIVKIPLSATGGGGATLNNIGTGFAWAATPTGDIKRAANSNTIVWDSTSTANSLTAKVDTSVIATQYDLTQTIPTLNATQVAFGSGSNTITSEPAFNYSSTTNYLTVDTVRNRKNIVDTTLYMPFVLIPNGQRYAAIGDSYTVGSAATVIPDSAYTGRLSEYYSLPLDNYAITGVGAITSTYQHFVNINYPSESLTGAMFGLNNLRYGGAGRKTINKILNGYKNIFCNNFSKTFYPASNTTVVTRHGSWTTGWASNSGGGKGGTQGAFTNTINDSIKYNFTDSTVWFSVIAGDGSGSIYTSPTIDVFIDGVFIETVDLNNQTDGQIDGSFDGRLIPLTRYYTGLAYGTHTLMVVNKSSLYLLFDGFGTLIDKSLANSYIIWHVPKLNPTGYATAPANDNDAITDTMNVKIDSLYATFPPWYPVYVARSNDYFDPHAGMSADSVHPNNLGHHQLFDAALAVLGSSSLSVETGSVFRANDNLYFKKQSELAKIVTGDAVFNQGQIIFNDTMLIGALNDKPVAIISNGQTAVAFRQNQGVYGNVMDAYGPIRAFGPVYAEAANIELRRSWAFSGGISNSIGTWTGGGTGWGLSENFIGIANSRFWGLMVQENGFFGRLVNDAGAFTNWLDVRRNGIHADSITFSMGKVFLGEMTRVASADSVLTWDVSTQQVRLVSKATTTSYVAGTTTNDDAVAGNIGEYVESNVASGSAVSLTNATSANITSISLTAGDWDVEGIINYVMTGATTANFSSGANSTSATLGGENTFTYTPLSTAGFTDQLGSNIPTRRFSLSGTTTIYLVGQATFSVGSVDGYGLLRARRVR